LYICSPPDGIVFVFQQQILYQIEGYFSNVRKILYVIERRNQLLHTIGNLTLLTKELNPSVSNGSWERKRKEILKHSALNMNRALPEEWDEGTIQKRAQDLFEHALKIWPRPKT
jgi:hypothetical protein